ncbi:Uncharacterised protein [Streptococcus pneumoniae]|nr:Uncharacterised protein [Streptococcus pneumoniae]CIV99346.1 Uncharacterised protein [Streptococcus pneumoniae]
MTSFIKICRESDYIQSYHLMNLFIATQILIKCFKIYSYIYPHCLKPRDNFSNIVALSWKIDKHLIHNFMRCKFNNFFLFNYRYFIMLKIRFIQNTYCYQFP